MTTLSLDQVAETLSGLEPRLLGDFPADFVSVTEDSRQVIVGSLFVVRQGERYDGRLFLSSAEQSGATALLLEAPIVESGLPQILVKDVPAALGRLAQRFSGDPSHELQVLAITGTNGKTTASYLVAQALALQGRKVARLGTLGFFIGAELVAETLTTPSAVDLGKQFRQALDQGVSDLVMEVSSHALAQCRTEGVRFAAAGLTNLTQDHLDFHRTMAEYARAKSRLFFESKPRHAVLNVGDEFGRELAARWSREGRAQADLIRYTAVPFSEGEIQVQRCELSSAGIRADLLIFGEGWSLSSALLGAHNLENLLLSLGLLLFRGISVPRALDSLSQAQAAQGRLEQVSTSQDDVSVLIDYAHTPDALRRSLLALRALKAQPLICVFGCGGDRDKTKRPQMGQVALELADEVVVTSDNPRTEDPLQIVKDIVHGLSSPGLHTVLDRPKAIFEAIVGAPAGSTIVVAGKGHETYQIIGTEKFPMDDAELARCALAERRGGSS